MGGGVFNFDGITFIMEVCLDHHVGRLQTAENLQFLLISSSGMSIKMNGLRVDGKVVVRSQAGVSKMPTAHALSGIRGKARCSGRWPSRTCNSPAQPSVYPWRKRQVAASRQASHRRRHHSCRPPVRLCCQAVSEPSAWASLR
jgi:hypothetical protein